MYKFLEEYLHTSPKYSKLPCIKDLIKLLLEPLSSIENRNLYDRIIYEYGHYGLDLTGKHENGTDVIEVFTDDHSKAILIDRIKDLIVNEILKLMNIDDKEVKVEVKREIVNAIVKRNIESILSGNRISPYTIIEKLARG